MAGQLKTYGSDPNAAISRRVDRGRAKKPAFIGLTVGKVVAVKVHDPKARADRTRLALVFNEHTESPQVLLFPENTAFESLRDDITREVALKVREFPEFLAQQPVASLSAEEVAETVTAAGEAAEL